MKVTAKLDTVVINGNDLEPLISFWKALLGVEEHYRSDDFVWLKPQHPNGAKLAFQKVPEEKGAEWNRVHIDLCVKDRAGAEARVLELGGSLLEKHEREGFQWTVFADPGGNEFCLVVE
jgi:catechol 2,3-dioxygenase-like lactoylglutathione lyase family enzyme